MLPYVELLTFFSCALRLNFSAVNYYTFSSVKVPVLIQSPFLFNRDARTDLEKVDSNNEEIMGVGQSLDKIVLIT